ncbi:hypothetical protein W97_00780 [Coniosporium apollinis CBS 100218]|uniref:Uncharacterized protein n=1 Tax=Coniosporium apollinis (strain CBS 100218) TaxID=1168221 RepID=R7YI49_CONA1|nr:uncharacterized protein W97_00780 [Coniosporium apollinis CBS 100218]EON61565.1 hypothetical protein W97_00780 [Coniosporium apollinis CBS 100218]
MKSPKWLKAIWETKGEEVEVVEVEIPLWEPPEGTSPRPTSISPTSELELGTDRERLREKRPWWDFWRVVGRL